MTALLIAGIVGMVAMFVVGWFAGRHYEHETAMDAARLVVLKHESNVLTRLQEIGQ